MLKYQKKELLKSPKITKIISNMLKRPFTYIIILILPVIFHFIKSKQNCNNNFLYIVRRSSYCDRIFLSGEITSKSKLTVTCPDVWPAPTIKYIVPERAYVDSGDVVCKLDCPQLVKDYNEAILNQKKIESEFKKQKANILLEEMLLKTRLEAVQSLQRASEIKQTQLEFQSKKQQKLLDLERQKYSIEIEKLAKLLELTTKINQYELEKINKSILKNRNLVQRAILFMDRLTLIAPGNGLVLHEKNPEKDARIAEGDRVWRRLPIMKIHDMERLHVIAVANETTIQRIWSDQRVDIYIDAIPGKCFEGFVQDVAHVGTVKNIKTRVKNFDIRIGFDNVDEQIMPGFSAACHIHSLTIPDTIVIPLECVFYRDSSSVVYLKESKKYRERDVCIARRNENFALIQNGLKGGEVLSLEKPPVHLIMSNQE